MPHEQPKELHDDDKVPQEYLRFNFSPEKTADIIANYVWTTHGRYPNYVRVNHDGSSVAEYDSDKN
jgi:hypothetical protein